LDGSRLEVIRVGMSDDNDISLGQVVKQASSFRIHRIRVDADVADCSKVYNQVDRHTNW
jgi:hypothetical protein